MQTNGTNTDCYHVTIDVSREEKLTYKLFYVTNRAQLKDATNWCRAQTDFAVDFETSGLDFYEDRIATIQVGNPFVDDPTAFVVDIRCFTSEELQPFLNAAFDPKKPKLGQNIKFECRFALGQLGMNLWNVRDTQLTELIIRAGLAPSGGTGSERAALGMASMAALCKRYLGININKDFELRTSFYKTAPGQHNFEQLEYAAGDVIYIYYVDKIQQEIVNERSLRSILQIENQLLPILALTEHTGIRMDTDKWMELWQEATASRIEVEEELHRMLVGTSQTELLPPTGAMYKFIYPKTGDALNFGSSMQVKFAIEEFCKRKNWPVQIITSIAQLRRLKKMYGADWAARTGKTADEAPDYCIPEDKYCILLNTDATTLRLARLKKQLPGEIVEKLLEFSKYKIREDTFGKEFLNKHLKKDGRIRPELYQAITSTGRLSASPNSMNIPSDPRYRACFIPTDGYSFVIADYSQIEPRLTAQESGDPVYLETFKNDDDIYLRVAEAMLGYRPDKTTEAGALERQIFKVIVLAMAYRMGPPKLQIRLALALESEILAGKTEFPSFEYVRNLHKSFLETFHNLHEYQNTCSNLADPQAPNPRTIWDTYLNAEVTWISSRCGRKRFFPMDAKNTYTEASNAPIQGGSATMTKAAIVMIQKEIRKQKFDARLVNVIHDELVYECRDDRAEEFALVVKECMEKAGAFYLPDVPVKAEFPKGTNGVVKYWTKEVKNG